MAVEDIYIMFVSEKSLVSQSDWFGGGQYPLVQVTYSHFNNLFPRHA